MLPCESARLPSEADRDRRWGVRALKRAQSGRREMSIIEQFVCKRASRWVEGEGVVVKRAREEKRAQLRRRCENAGLRSPPRR